MPAHMVRIRTWRPIAAAPVMVRLPLVQRRGRGGSSGRSLPAASFPAQRRPRCRWHPRPEPQLRPAGLTSHMWSISSRNFGHAGDWPFQTTGPGSSDTRRSGSFPSASVTPVASTRVFTLGQRSDPEHRSYRSLASFSDPDGNGWLFQDSPRGCPVASTPQRRALHRQAILRAHFGVRRQPTVSTRSAPDSAMRTGQTGTPHRWWRSNLAKSCRNEQPRRDRHRPGGTARLLIADSWRIHERRNNHRSHPARTGTLRANYRCHRRQAALHGPHMRPPQRHRTGGRVYGRGCAPIF